MTTKSTSPSILSRAFTINPLVREAAFEVYMNLILFQCSKRKYFERFILPILGENIFYRQFDAVTSSRYCQNGELPTRGKHRDRSGVVKTIPYSLYLAMKESAKPAKEALKGEFPLNKEKQTTNNKKTYERN